MEAGMMRGSRIKRRLTSLAVILLVPACNVSPPVPTAAAADSVLVVRYQSIILGQERELIIHLPRGYDATQRYPVLYVLDGSSQDQPLADKLDSLYGERAVPQTIVVGIPNMSGSNRTLQLVPPFMRTDPENPDSPLGTGDQFLEFMEKELIPFIEAHYGASPTRLFAGNSRGGLLVMYSLVQKPDLFAGRFCYSTPLWRENNLLVARVSTFLRSRSVFNSFLYVSAGANETANILSGLDTLAAVLDNAAPSGVVWYVERTPGVDHQLNAAVSGWSSLRKWGAYATRRAVVPPN